MSKLQKAWLVFSGLIILAIAYLIAFTSAGLSIVVLIISFSILVYAIRQLGIYCTTARYMVGGKSFLFKGLIAVDFALFFLALQDVKVEYIMIYLIVLYFASGAIDLFRALEIRKLKHRAWIRKAAAGLFNIIIAVLCIIFIKSYNLMCLIYGVGLVFTAFRRMARAFRKTEMVYIQ